MVLKYLFTAHYADNLSLVQNAEDTSKIDPIKRSSYYDVLDHAKTSPVVRFELEGGGHKYAVDLKDGHFEIDGVPFLMHEEVDLGQLELVFFRQHTHQIAVGGSRPQELGHLVSYNIGWQVIKNGKNYQRVLRVS